MRQTELGWSAMPKGPAHCADGGSYVFDGIIYELNGV